MPFTLFSKGAELIFTDQATRSYAPVQHVPLLEPKVQEPVKPPTQTYTTQNATPKVNIPKVIESVFEGIPKETTRPVFINVNVTTQQAASTAHTDTPEAQEPAQPSIPPIKPVPPTPQPTATAASPTPRQGPMQYVSQAKEWVLSHKIRCALYCGATIYGGLHLYLWRASRSLSKSERWSLWKPICSLNDLYQMNQSELLKSFMGSLTESYQNNNHLTNAQRFVKEAADELSLLKRYKGIVEFLDRWYLRSIFFVNRSYLSTIPERIQRLEFLKNTIAGWLKNHQLTYCYDKLFTTSGHAYNKPHGDVL